MFWDAILCFKSELKVTSTPCPTWKYSEDPLRCITKNQNSNFETFLFHLDAQKKEYFGKNIPLQYTDQILPKFESLTRTNT